MTRNERKAKSLDGCPFPGAGHHLYLLFRVLETEVSLLPVIQIMKANDPNHK